MSYGVTNITNIRRVIEISKIDFKGIKIDLLIMEINKNEFQFNVSQLKSGLYQLQIETNQGFENMIIKID